MARHARPSPAQRIWAGTGSRFVRWAARFRPVKSPGRHEKQAGGNAGRKRGSLLLATALAAAAVYAAYFVLGRPPSGTGPAPTRLTAAHHRTGAASRPATSAAPAVSAASVPDAQPNPPPPLAGAAVTGGSAAAAASTATSQPAAHPAGRNPGASASRPGRGTPTAPARGTPKAAAKAGSASQTPGARTSASKGPSARASAFAAAGGHAASATSAAVRVATSLRAAAPGIRPPVTGKLLAGFGWAYSPIFSDWQEHTGVDLAASPGEAVRAPASGVVLAVRHDPLWGDVVSLSLPGGYSSNISALATVRVKPGDKLRAGQTLGTAGSSPPAEANLAPHVFWQVFDGTNPVNPLG